MFNLFAMDDLAFLGFLLLINLALALFVASTAHKKGHSYGGYFLLALCLPVISLLLALLVRDKKKEELAASEAEWALYAKAQADKQKSESLRREEEERKRLRRKKLIIARGGETLDPITVSRIEEMLDLGELSEEDHYWSEDGQQWRPLRQLHLEPA
jgi:hypothetical protein